MAWEDKRVHVILESISLKVNVIVRLDFELAYYDVAVQLASRYATETPLPLFWGKVNMTSPLQTASQLLHRFGRNWNNSDALQI